MSAHRVLPDGYCETCHAIPCRGSSSPVGSTRQLDRIETKLNRVLRHLGLEDDS